MPKQTDPLKDDIDRVYGEYHAARDAHDANPDPLSKARFDRAQVALQETRRQWREIGEVSGQRGTFVQTADNSEPPPDLIGRHVTGKGQG